MSILLQTKLIQPDGYILLVIPAIIGLAVFLWFFAIDRKSRAFGKISISIVVSSRNKSEAYVKIKNSGRIPLEILPPVLSFVRRKSIRSFIVKTGEKDQLFPMYLFPKTHYDFRIDFDNFFSRDVRLKKFRKFRIDVKGKSGKILKSAITKVP